MREAHVSLTPGHLSKRADHVLKRLAHLSKRADHVLKGLAHLSKRVDHALKGPPHASKRADHALKGPAHASKRADHALKGPAHASKRADHVSEGPGHDSQRATTFRQDWVAFHCQAQHKGQPRDPKWKQTRSLTLCPSDQLRPRKPSLERGRAVGGSAGSNVASGVDARSHGHGGGTVET